MKRIQFKIFQKEKKFILSANLVVYSLFAITLPFTYLVDKVFENETLRTIGYSGVCLSFSLAILFKIIQHFRRKTLKGKFIGTLEFKTNSIKVGDDEYHLDQIEKMVFDVGDYIDKLEVAVYGDFNPTRSNGVDNLCGITLRTGEKLTIYFQQTYENQFLWTKDILINYFVNHKITFLKLIQILKIDGYKNVQKFKKTLPPTKPKSKRAESAIFENTTIKKLRIG